MAKNSRRPESTGGVTGGLVGSGRRDDRTGESQSWADSMVEIRPPSWRSPRFVDHRGWRARRIWVSTNAHCASVAAAGDLQIAGFARGESPQPVFLHGVSRHVVFRPTESHPGAG